MIVKTIGENLRTLRRKRGLTQTDIAQYLDVTFQQVQKYENGSNRITADKLYLLKNFYDTDYDAFFKGLEARTREN